jgi:hypothetical protein
MTWERRLNETPTAPTKKLSTSLPAGTDHPKDACPSFAQRLQWRRRVAVELDHLLDVWKYPNPSEVYAIPPSREPEACP